MLIHKSNQNKGNTRVALHGEQQLYRKTKPPETLFEGSLVVPNKTDENLLLPPRKRDIRGMLQREL